MASRLEILGPLTSDERDGLVTNGNMGPYSVILNTTSGQLEYWEAPSWKGGLGDSISIPGTLGVLDAVSFSYTLTVSGHVQADTTLGVTGNATVGGTLGVTGATSLGTLTAATLTTTGNVTIGGTFGVSGATSLSALTASGVVGFGSTLTVTGHVQATSTLGVTGNATVGGTLGVTGNATLGNAAVGALAVTGNATIGGTLGVSGATTLAALTATGAAALQSTLAVTGAATLNSTLDVTGLLNTAGSIRMGNDTAIQNSSGIGIVKFPGSADALRIIYPTLINADADPAAGVGLEVRGKELVTGEIEIDGALNHDGANVGFYGTAPATQATVTGSRGGNAALADLLTKLALTGIIVDSTT